MYKKSALIFVIFVLATMCLFAKAKTSKTVYGDCNSSDTKKHYVSKTYTDVSGNGKYDHVTTHDCNGKISTSKYKGAISNPIHGGFWDTHEVDQVRHDLISIEYNELEEVAFIYELYDQTTGLLLATEFKDFNSNVVTLIVH